MVGSMWGSCYTWGMPETWYCRTGTGAACGLGTREPLIKFEAGAADTSRTLTTTGNTWNRQTSPGRTIPAGDWTVTADVFVTTGLGNVTLRCIVQRVNSACINVGGAIIDQTSGNLTKNAVQTVVFGPVNPGQLTIGNNDILLVQFIVSVVSSPNVSLRYNGAAGGTFDSRIDHPAFLIGAYHHRRRLEVT
jgi:hypothetical protein